MYLDQFEGGGIGATIAGVTNSVATDGNAHLVWVFLLGLILLTDNFGVGYLTKTARRNITVCDEMKGVGTLDSFLGGVQRVMADALA